VREEENKSGFTVVDKRGQNNPVREKIDVAVNDADLPVQDRKWESVAYQITVQPHPDGSTLFGGQVVGLANDENLFTAVYIFGMRWEAGFDWTVDARRRLDSFLQCACTNTVKCSYHRRMAPHGWLKEDFDRIREEGAKPVPKAIEILFKAERARQQAQRILAPRR